MGKRHIVYDGYDQMAFESVLSHSRIKQLCEEQEGIVKDVFTSFHRTSPMLEETSSGIAKELLSELLALKDFKDFHQTSQLDPMCSGIGTMSMAPALIQKLKDVEKEIESQRQRERERNELDGKDSEDGVPQGEGSLEELGPEGQAALRQSLRAAIEEAQQEADEVSGLFRSWGVDSGELKNMDVQERFDLADRIRKAGRLKNVSEFIGRFKNVVNSTLATTPSGNDEIVDIAQGDDIARMLPSEAIKLMQNPLLFFKDFTEKSLLTYSLKGTDNLGKGPLIVCFDISGSMHGSREAWAKAVVISLMGYAQKQGRAFAWISFESRVHDSEFYPKGHLIPLSEKIRVAETSTTGGTDFWKPLQKAQELHALETDLKPADVVFITDGEADLDASQEEKIQTWKKQKDVRIFGVGIKEWANSDFKLLNKFCDSICTVDKQGDVSPLKEVVKLVHKERA